ncbi:MAG TPA: class I SAM-dependent methyltransferase [Aggregatilineales bacterium]|nr:class I SAM-dependent methyltransferase [Aggregatilineales bacterium]
MSDPKSPSPETTQNLKIPGSSSEAFDRIGARYDDEYTNTDLSRWFRHRVWDRLEVLFKPGDSVIEFGCGTGEDALWLAKRGIYVLASDGSQAMLAETKRKAKEAGLSTFIETRLLDLTDAEGWSLPDRTFDGAFSNYGPLNCVGDWAALGEQLAHTLRSGSKIGLGVMGPICPWEIFWHGIHGDFRNATRRFRHSAVAHLDGKYFRVYYPTPARLQRDLGPKFRRTLLWGLGVFLPPSDLYRGVGKRQWLARPLLAMERLTAPYWPFKYLGDHYWLELEMS